MSMSEGRLISSIINRSPKSSRGFTLVELLVATVIAGIVIAGIYSFLAKQRRTSTRQRLRADIESLDTISFFIIGRDIRRAGSNPKGAMGYSVGVDIPLAQATFDTLEIKADLDGNGSVSGGDEDIKYEWVDTNGAPIPGAQNQIRRQAGNALVIENVRQFDIDYQVASGGWYCRAGRCAAPYNVAPWTSPPPDPSLIRKVRLHIKAGTGRINRDTGVEDMKEIQETI